MRYVGQRRVGPRSWYAACSSRVMQPFLPHAQIKDIEPPASVRAAMEMEAAAERRKRAQVGGETLGYA